jgi:hypothetical protein
MQTAFLDPAEPASWIALDEPGEWQSFSRELAGSEGWG